MKVSYLIVLNYKFQSRKIKIASTDFECYNVIAILT